jgi:hypothetical protein
MVTFARDATLPIAEHWTNPSSSIVARNAIHTIRVGSGSSQIDDNMILENSLLYILLPSVTPALQHCGYRRMRIPLQ